LQAANCAFGLAHAMNPQFYKSIYAAST
jgi:hypothetical protein